MRIEKRIYDIVPSIDRKSSGSSQYTKDLYQRLSSTGHFQDCIFVEAEHEVVMTCERYLGAWKSVNDIQAQAGPEKWQEVLAAIEDEISGLSEVVVPYKTRSWTVQRAS